MIADIFCPIIHPKNHRFSVFYMRKKMFWGFAPTSSPMHRPGALGGFQLPPDPQLLSFLAWPKIDASMFFLHYPLTISIQIFLLSFLFFV